MPLYDVVSDNHVVHAVCIVLTTLSAMRPTQELLYTRNSLGTKHIVEYATVVIM